VRDKARLIWISNEYELGDFGMGGVHIKRGGYITNGKVFADRGAAVMIRQGDLTAAALESKVLYLLQSETVLSRMKEAARSLAVVDSANRLADLVRAVIAENT